MNETTDHNIEYALELLRGLPEDDIAYAFVLAWIQAKGRPSEADIVSMSTKYLDAKGIPLNRTVSFNYARFLIYGLGFRPQLAWSTSKAVHDVGRYIEED